MLCRYVGCLHTSRKEPDVRINHRTRDARYQPSSTGSRTSCWSSPVEAAKTTGKLRGPKPVWPVVPTGTGAARARTLPTRHPYLSPVPSQSFSEPTAMRCLSLASSNVCLSPYGYIPGCSEARKQLVVIPTFLDPLSPAQPAGLACPGWPGPMGPHRAPCGKASRPGLSKLASSHAPSYNPMASPAISLGIY